MTALDTLGGEKTVLLRDAQAGRDLGGDAGEHRGGRRAGVLPDL